MRSREQPGGEHVMEIRIEFQASRNCCHGTVQAEDWDGGVGGDPLEACPAAQAPCTGLSTTQGLTGKS